MVPDDSVGRPTSSFSEIMCTLLHRLGATDTEDVDRGSGSIPNSNCDLSTLPFLFLSRYAGRITGRFSGIAMDL